MEFVAGPQELLELRKAGVAYEVMIPDLAAYYAARMSPVPENALGFGYGSMGGFYTLAEVYQQLDSMRLLYPSIITARESIGTTTEGRAIWAVKLSDNPGTHEPGEPEVLYTALHHAREPQGMMALIYTLWWLLENHAADPEAAYLVNTRQMWFIPVINPDGYFYNQTTNPSGGGMWRKNRRNNGGSYGVDLNRNYGPYYMWNAPNGGSGTTPSSDTYRGSTEFSEPETQAIDRFMRAHTIRAALNYHTYSNLLIYPWGYLSRESGDSLLFRDWTFDMTAVNRYVNGTDLQTVAYATRGGSDDYMYGDSTKPRTYALTPEVGTTGFWPSVSEIFPLAIENLRANLFLAHVGGQLPRLRGVRVLEADSNGSVTAGEQFVLAGRIRNLGLGTASSVTVEPLPDVPWITFTPSSVPLPVLASQTETEILLAGRADSAAPVAGRFHVVLRYTDPDGLTLRDTVRLYLGAPAVLFSDSASTGTGNWSTGSGWGTTTNAHTPPFAFTDSPAGNYSANANNALTMSGTVNLTSYQFAQLRFWARWSVEPAWDFATVEVSTNAGSSWSVLRTEYTRKGSGRSGGQQPSGSFGFDSYTPGLQWTEQSADLTPYAGRQIKVRFRLASDGADQRDGIFVDDIRVIAYTTTLPPVPPAPPALVAPPDGASYLPPGVRVVWNSVAGASSYHLQVATDSLFAVLVVNDSALTDTARTLNGLAAGVTHHWRVRGKNAGGSGAFSAARRFTTAGSVMRALAMQAGWNLVSVPVRVADPRAASLFPGAVSPVYRFSGSQGYLASDTLECGSGYWVKFDTAASVEITGVQVSPDTVPLAAGWNMIGTVSEAVDSAAVEQVPPGVVQTSFYEYGGGYTASTVLQPGRGYWVKAGQTGYLVFRLAAPLRANPARERVENGR